MFNSDKVLVKGVDLINGMKNVWAWFRSLELDLGEFQSLVDIHDCPNISMLDENPTEQTQEGELKHMAKPVSGSKARNISINIVASLVRWREQLGNAGYNVDSFDYNDDGVIVANCVKDGNSQTITPQLYATITGLSAA